MEIGERNANHQKKNRNFDVNKNSYNKCMKTSDRQLKSFFALIQALPLIKKSF